MNLLALSSSAKRASAALYRNGCFLAETFADESRKHAETLLPLVDALLGENGLAPADIELLAVDMGPGSFTGVRIGVSSANAMALALGKPVAGVDALTALMLAAEGRATRICALIDAAHGNAYAARFENGRLTQGPDAVAMDAYAGQIPAGSYIVGDGAAVFAQILQERVPDVRLCSEAALLPSARFVAEAAMRSPALAQKQALPLYLRPSQAERLFAERRGNA